MKKPKRKLKVEFLKEITKPKEKKEAKEKQEELEEIVQTSSETIKKPLIETSPNLKLEETPLELQVANTSQTKETNNQNQTQAYQTIIQHNSQQQNSNYQDSSYQTINFAPPPTSLSSEFSPQQESFKNPMIGFNQSNPFETPGYPKIPEKNYESINKNDKKRRM